MDDKSKPGGVSRWWKQIVGITVSDSGRVCEKGHPMDPNWKTCAYCDAENRAHRKTVHEPDEIESNKSIERSITMQRRTTQIDSGESDEGRGATKLETSANVAPQRAESDAVQQQLKPNMHRGKLTGILVTFSRRSQGELFPLYEGRNVIGSAEDSCDVHVSCNDDKMVSGEHAVILCRAGRDELHDMLSTNGTYLDEKYVERDGADLRDGALIRTGGTVFEYRKFTSGGDRTQETDRPRGEDNIPGNRSQGETSI